MSAEDLLDIYTYMYTVWYSNPVKGHNDTIIVSWSRWQLKMFDHPCNALQFYVLQKAFLELYKLEIPRKRYRTSNFRVHLKPIIGVYIWCERTRWLDFSFLAPAFSRPNGENLIWWLQKWTNHGLNNYLHNIENHQVFALFCSTHLSSGVCEESTLHCDC